MATPLTTPTTTAVIPSSSGQISIGTAGTGGTITGQPVYIDTSNSNVIRLANADSAGSAIIAAVAGIALNTAAAGQKVMYCTGDPSFTHGLTAADIAPGDLVMLHDSAGIMTITPGELESGDWVCYIGQINNPETTMNLAPKAPILKA